MTVWPRSPPEAIRALGTVTTIPVAASIFGLSRSVAYDLVRTDQFPVPILRFGTRYRIPVAAILAALRMPAEAPARLETTAAPSVDRTHPTSGRPAGPTPP
ncbi:helix-turn-helix domain-containing protein [Asanoa sp. NPDC049518]|uniref:helix-turn-helix domain-containing protein n=1 Tax=unclassified Asanoa TaxID=2685164 RepID=UPI0034191100